MLKTKKQIRSFKLNPCLTLKLKPAEIASLDSTTTKINTFLLLLIYCKTKLRVRHIKVLKNLANRSFFIKKSKKSSIPK